MQRNHHISGRKTFRTMLAAVADAGESAMTTEQFVTVVPGPRATKYAHGRTDELLPHHRKAG